MKVVSLKLDEDCIEAIKCKCRTDRINYTVWMRNTIYEKMKQLRIFPELKEDDVPMDDSEWESSPGFIFKTE